MVFKVGFATLPRNGSSPPGGPLSTWPSVRWFSFALPMLLASSSHGVERVLPLDSPLGQLRPSVERAWLLERNTLPPPAAWPLDRQTWLELPATPRLLFHTSQAEPERWALFQVKEPDLRVGAGLRAEAIAWRRQDGQRVDEVGNGLDVEGSWASHLSFWAHVRDLGVTAKGGLAKEDLPPASDNWLWFETSHNALTHDEARTGLAFAHAVGRHGRLHLAMTREHLRWGSGLLRTAGIQGNATANWPMLLLSFHQGALSYTQEVGQLFSDLWSTGPDSVEVGDRVRRHAREKWLVGHRLEWRAPWGSLAASEAVVLGDRRPDLGYLAPVGLVWSEQHALKDQDNSLFFLDARLRLPRLLPGAWMLYGDLLLDDYSFSDLGEELEGQRVASLWGLSGCPLPTPTPGSMRLGSLELPGISWCTVEMGRQRPFVGGHFYGINRFEQAGRSLALFEEPNTRGLEWEWRHEASLPRLALGPLGLEGLVELRLEGGHLVHGANTDSLNVGGDRLVPHEEDLPQEAPFLAGSLEVQDRRAWSVDLSFLVKWHQRGLGHVQLGYQDERLSCRPDSLDQGWRSLSLAWRMPL